jgi:hypothetical protein
MTEVTATSIMYDTENNSMLHILHIFVHQLNEMINFIAIYPHIQQDDSYVVTYCMWKARIVLSNQLVKYPALVRCLTTKTHCLFNW